MDHTPQETRFFEFWPVEKSHIILEFDKEKLTAARQISKKPVRTPKNVWKRN